MKDIKEVPPIELGGTSFVKKVNKSVFTANFNYRLCLPFQHPWVCTGTDLASRGQITPRK